MPFCVGNKVPTGAEGGIDCEERWWELANIDWVKIKNEYINTNISYRKLSERYNVSKNQIANRAKKEKWSELRSKQRDKIGTKLGQKTAEKIVEAETDRIAGLIKLADEAQKQIGIGLMQLDKYVDTGGKVHQCEMIDVERLKKLVATMKDLKDIIKTDNSGDMQKLDNVLEKIKGGI